jgi:hypothetical protein
VSSPSPSGAQLLGLLMEVAEGQLPGRGERLDSAELISMSARLRYPDEHNHRLLKSRSHPPYMRRMFLHRAT